jgi:hypothetical protein
MNRRALTVADRIDAVAGAVAHFQRAMMMDVDQAAKAMRDEEMLAEIEDFIDGFNQAHLPAACGSTASGSLPGHPEMGGLVIRGQMRSGSNKPPVVRCLAAFAFATERRFACGF